jgi:hypothetical protein
MLEVHLVADPRTGRDHADAVERLLRPSQQRVPFPVAPVLPLDVRLVRLRGAEQVDLHRVIDDQIHVHQRGDPGRVAAGALHRRSHRGQVDDRGHAREVLHQHPRGHEGKVGARRLPRPGRERPNVILGDVAGAGAAEQVLEQDLDGMREPVELGDLREPVELDRTVAGLQSGPGSERVAHGSMLSDASAKLGDRLSVPILVSRRILASR